MARLGEIFVLWKFSLYSVRYMYNCVIVNVLTLPLLSVSMFMKVSCMRFKNGYTVNEKKCANSYIYSCSTQVLHPHIFLQWAYMYNTSITLLYIHMYQYMQGYTIWDTIHHIYIQNSVSCIHVTTCMSSRYHFEYLNIRVFSSQLEDSEQPHTRSLPH